MLHLKTKCYNANLTAAFNKLETYLNRFEALSESLI